MGTNAALIVFLGLLYWLVGLAPILLIWLPTSLVAATVGVWLFYVQHQFETAHWDRERLAPA